MQVKPLSPPRSLLQWYLEKSKLDMDPSYQRRSGLWSERYKALLINSVINQYDIPKFYVADFTYINSSLNEERKPYAVIDGKQRFNAFFEFFDNNLKLGDTPVIVRGQAISLKGLRYKEIASNYVSVARIIEEYIPAVMSVITDDLEDIQELFIRLNLSIAISGPETRNAMSGPMPGIIRKLSVNNFFRNYAIFPVSRGQDLNMAAKLFLLEQNGKFTASKKKELDKLFIDNEKKDPRHLMKYSDKVEKNLDKMTKIFIQKDELLSKPAQIPCYYMFIKEYGDKYGSIIRNFLIQFEKDRDVVRQESRARSQGTNTNISDSDLLQYNLDIRSPDDRSKQESMYKILLRRFSQFTK